VQFGTSVDIYIYISRQRLRYGCELGVFDISRNFCVAQNYSNSFEGTENMNYRAATVIGCCCYGNPKLRNASDKFQAFKTKFMCAHASVSRRRGLVMECPDRSKYTNCSVKSDELAFYHCAECRRADARRC
jgi:hypothetical protein